MIFCRNIIIALVAMVFLCGCLGRPHVARGLQNGMLLPCPQTPNCATTSGKQDVLSEKPLTYYGFTREEAREAIIYVINELGNATIKEQGNNYFWVECRSRLLRFSDDLEIYLPEKQKVVHIRSASRIGYYDFGANQKRIDDIRKLFRKKIKANVQPSS